MPILTFVEAGLPHAHRLHDGDNLIGRAATCDLVIALPDVSRQHALVRVTAGKVLLRDLGSTAGTFLKGSKITGEHELQPGDTFIVAHVAVTLTSSSTGHSNAIELIEDGHVMVDMSHSVVRAVAPPDAASAQSPGVASLSEQRGANRRSGTDRRQSNHGRREGERRSGRDRRGGRIVRLLTEIGKTLLRVQGIAQVLERVVDLVFDALPAERAFLLLRDSIDEPVTARVARLRDGTRPAKATLSRTIVNKVMRERVAMLAKDALYDSRLGTSGSVQLTNVRSFMCAPLWSGDEVIGVLYCDNPRSKKFNEDDLDVFVALCNYAAVAIEQSRLSAQLAEQTRQRERLQRYHSPAVTNQIVHGSGEDGGLAARTRDLSVMFCDIAGFTGLTQHLAPAAVGELLNEFFERMTDVLFDHDGTLDKFIGDAILAVFGAPLDQPDHATRAVAAALAMQRELRQLNAEHPNRPIRMRVAINSGEALTGDIGSPRRREFTVLGDVVNIASRMESSVAQPGQIVISQFTKERLAGAFKLRPLGGVKLRGRDEAVDMFEVVE